MDVSTVVPVHNKEENIAALSNVIRGTSRYGLQKRLQVGIIDLFGVR